MEELTRDAGREEMWEVDGTCIHALFVDLLPYGYVLESVSRDCDHSAPGLPVR